MKTAMLRRMQAYQATALFSVLFALLGFSYNVWRMEISEQNNNVRTASFEMLKELSELEQLVYIAHYDQDLQAGSPRKGWIKVGLINELSLLLDPQVAMQAKALHGVWSAHWPTLHDQQASAEAVVNAIEQVRTALRQVLINLD